MFSYLGRNSGGENAHFSGARGLDSSGAKHAELADLAGGMCTLRFPKVRVLAIMMRNIIYWGGPLIFGNSLILDEHAARGNAGKPETFNARS